jgi:hypothetical protein
MTHKSQERANEALHNATVGQSLTNYPAIFDGFMEMGIPEEDILPRENVFTFNAWIAKGRIVRKGQHGVKCVTFVPADVKDAQTGETKFKGRRPSTVTVFHISQTEELRK